MVGSGDRKEEEEIVEVHTVKGLRYKNLKLGRWVIWLGSLLGSSFGGALILVGWTIRYHQSNTQLWMVPLGLILFSVPLIISCAVVSAATSDKRSEELRTDVEEDRLANTFSFV